MNYIEQFSDANRLRLWVLYDQLCDNWLQRHKDNDRLMRITHRNIANAIHDCGAFWTGYISVAALNRILITNKPPNKICAFDHFYGRVNSGEVIAKMFFDDTPTMDDFAKMMYDHCRVHRILKEENNKLTAFQNNKGMSWIGAYNAAGIEMVHIPMEDRKQLTRKYLKQFEYSEPTPLEDIYNSIQL